jgi:hypothetical protein
VVINKKKTAARSLALSKSKREQGGENCAKRVAIFLCFGRVARTQPAKWRWRERPRLATRRQVTNLEPPFVSQVDISSTATIYQQQLHTLRVVVCAVVPLCVKEREREKSGAPLASLLLYLLYFRPQSSCLSLAIHLGPGNHFIERLQFERCRVDAVSLI